MAQPPADAYVIGPGNIAKLTRVDIGGHSLAMMIRGRSTTNPVLLFLAGGPVAGEMGGCAGMAKRRCLPRPDLGYGMYPQRLEGELDPEGGRGHVTLSPRSSTGMPTRLPVIPGLSLDAQYAAAGGRRSGERAWFDVLALPDGRAAMLVGAVGQQGIPPAVVAQDVRGSFGPLLAENHDLAPALERLRRGRGTVDEPYATTACVAVVDPRDGRVQYSTGGHHPPLLIDAAGRTRYLEPTGGGGFAKQSATVGTTRLVGAEVLVLCSDGLSPEARQALAAGLADGEPAEDASAGKGRPDDAHGVRTAAVCRTTAQAIRRAGNPGGFAIIAVQPRAVPPRLEVTVPAVGASLESAREAVGNWLSGLRSSVEDGAGMALAIGEAMANAVQHAFVGTRTGTVSIEASLLDDGVLSCSVRDDGRWLGTESSDLEGAGRGLALMARVSDWMELSRGPGGTVVRLRRQLHHPVIDGVAPDDN